MVDRKTQTVLRGIRIPKQLNELLQKYAEAVKRTVSALVLSILTKYAEWDRYTEKFGFVTVPRSTYKRMIETMDEQAYLVATEEAPSTFLEMIRFWWRLHHHPSTRLWHEVFQSTKTRLRNCDA